MKVVLVGRDADRARLRAELAERDLEIVAETTTIAAARNGAYDADAIVIAEPLDEQDEGAEETSMAFDEPLTPRELEVLTLMADGCANKVIAEKLGIGVQTVKFHVASIIGKMGAVNRTDAVQRALRRGLIAI